MCIYCMYYVCMYESMFVCMNIRMYVCMYVCMQYFKYMFINTAGLQYKDELCAPTDLLP